MSFKSGVEGRGSGRWWERRWWLWWGDMRRMRWTRRTVNRMRLTVALVARLANKTGYLRQSRHCLAQMLPSLHTLATNLSWFSRNRT